MSDDITDLPSALIPYDGVYEKVVHASMGGVCEVDGVQMSSFKFFEDLSKNPQNYSHWKTALVDAGVSAAALTAGGPILLAAGPVGWAALLGTLIAAPFFGKNRCALLILGNGTEGELIKSGLYLNCGVQTGAPAYVETNLITGSKKPSRKDVIPGSDFTSIPGFLQMGAGMYQFEKDLDLGIGFYGTGGAISFTCTDPKVGKDFGIAWLVPEMGDPHLYVTADVSQYSDLEDFYMRTCEKGKNNMSASARKGKNKGYIRGSAVPRNFPDDKDAKNLVFTITVKQ